MVLTVARSFNQHLTYHSVSMGIVFTLVGRYDLLESDILALFTIIHLKSNPSRYYILYTEDYHRIIDK